MESLARSNKLFALLGCAFLLAACGPREPAPQAQPPKPAPTPAATTTAPRAPADAGGAPDAGTPDSGVVSELRLEPIEPERAAAPAPHVEILFPFAEQRILIPKARAYVVRVRVDAWPLAREGRGVVIALDDARPRRVLPKTELHLGELATEGRELAAGAHWLTLAAVDERGAVVRGAGGSLAGFAKVHFWVGERDLAVRPGPEVTLISPAGTYNGRAAERVLLDFVAAPERLGLSGGRAKLSVTGAGQTRTTELENWQPVALSGLPSGDFEVEVVLEDPSGRPLGGAGAKATRVITVNRDVGGR